MASIDLGNPKIAPAALREVTAELERAGMMKINNPSLVAKYAASLINRLTDAGYRALASTRIAVSFSDEAISARVAVDHGLGGREPPLTLYLNEGQECELALDMTRGQFTDLCAFMRRAIATGLPASLRLGQGEPGFLLDPYQGTRTLLSEEVPGAEGPL